MLSNLRCTFPELPAVQELKVHAEIHQQVLWLGLRLVLRQEEDPEAEEAFQVLEVWEEQQEHQDTLQYLYSSIQ
jgi:hypothetical protein